MLRLAGFFCMKGRIMVCRHILSG